MPDAVKEEKGGGDDNQTMKGTEADFQGKHRTRG